MSARAAGVDVSAEGRGPAAHDGAEHRSLLHAQPRMLLDEGVALRVEDLGHLHGGPAHGATGFRSSRDRWTTTGVGTCNCSSGFGAACRWRCDRCK